MYEGLDLPVRRDLPADLRDLDQAELTRAYYALGPHFEPEIEGAVVGVVGLSGNVDRDIRTGLAGQHEHARIRHQDRVRSQLRQLAKILLRPGKIAVVGQNIGCDEHFYAMIMGVLYSLRHFIPGKVPGLGAKSVGLSAYIHGVRAVSDSGLQNFQVLGRQQELRLFCKFFFSHCLL